MPKTFSPLEPQTVLAVVAHPDDIEYCFGGTIAAWTATGAAVHYLILTDGSNGSSDPSVIGDQMMLTRQEEQRAAATILGAQNVIFSPYKDGELQNSRETVETIVRAIRELQPDVVLAFDPTQVYSADHDLINHPDHRAAGQATLDAVFPYARNAGSFPHLLEQGLQPHSVKTVILHNTDTHNFYVNISDTLEKKLEAFAAHKSQAHDVEVMTPRLRTSAEAAGAHIGAKYAEGFVRIDTL